MPAVGGLPLRQECAGGGSSSAEEASADSSSAEAAAAATERSREAAGGPSFSTACWRCLYRAEDDNAEAPDSYVARASDDALARAWLESLAFPGLAWGAQQRLAPGSCSGWALPPAASSFEVELRKSHADRHGPL